MRGKIYAKLAIIFLLLLVIATPSHAINLLEKIVYKKDVIKVYNTKILVNPVTNEIKYIWYETVPAGTNGHWEPVSGVIQYNFQAAYDQQRSSQKSVISQIGDLLK